MHGSHPPEQLQHDALHDTRFQPPRRALDDLRGAPQRTNAALDINRVHSEPPAEGRSYMGGCEFVQLWVSDDTSRHHGRALGADMRNVV
eukprot:5292165-Pyramimonas_sp.AAC.1